MGVRFACHVCGKQLNIKRELAGRRGVCPACSARFRIPLEDAETSTPVDQKPRGTGRDRAAGAVATASTTSQATRSRRSEGATRAVATDAESPIDESVVDQDQPVRRQADVSGLEQGMGADSLLDDDSEAAWYVRPPSGGQYGPASGEILRQWIAEGRVAATALLWRDGWPQWREASEALPELAARLPSGLVSSPVTSPVTSPDAPAIGEVDQKTVTTPLVGQSKVGTARRARSSRRVWLISVLTAVAVALIAILLVLISRSGG